MYNLLRKIYKRLRFYLKINWYKTLYFNFKMFPFAIAKKLPVYVYEWVKFSSLTGEILIDAPLKRGMIGFGQPYEMVTRSRGISEICLKGKLVIKGHVQFGKDFFLWVGDSGYCEMGHMSSIASNGKIICENKIVLGEFSRIGSESQLIDTNFHTMMDTQTKEKFPMTGEIQLGNYNFISNRVSIMQKAKTPDFCTVASNTLCNKDYTYLGENILIGGIPAKLLKENISRDWLGEKDMLDKYLIIKW